MWYREEMMESTRMVFIRLGNKPLVNGGGGGRGVVLSIISSSI